MKTSEDASLRIVDRRRFLTGTGAAAVVGSAATMGVASPAEAGERHGRVFSRSSAPKPILAQVDTTAPGGPTPLAPFNLIHWLLPGPEGATTQVLQLPAFGLDADPSTITDFDGFVAYAVLGGKARGGDGESYDVEFDVRVMDGRYIGEDGKEHRGTFGFF